MAYCNNRDFNKCHDILKILKKKREKNIQKKKDL